MTFYTFTGIYNEMKGDTIEHWDGSARKINIQVLLMIYITNLLKICRSDDAPADHILWHS